MWTVNWQFGQRIVTYLSCLWTTLPYVVYKNITNWDTNNKYIVGSIFLKVKSIDFTPNTFRKIAILVILCYMGKLPGTLSVSLPVEPMWSTHGHIHMYNVCSNYNF